jgi:hypothetical protein
MGILLLGYPTSPQGWNVLRIGGGGQVTNLDYPTSSAGTRTNPFLITCDTAGAWSFNFSTGTWVQIINSASMPTAFKGNGNFLDGAYGCVSALSDPTRGYLAYNVYNGGENTGHILVSNNVNAADPSTITWTDTAFSGGNWGPNVSSYKFVGPKIAVDPANKDIVYVCTPSSGQLVTTNGGALWSAVPNVTASAGGIPGCGIAFDPTSVSGGKSQTIWICTQGDGVWRSTNGGTSFSKQTSGTGPTNVGRAKIGIDGTYYATEYDSSKLWRFTTTWTDITPAAAVGQGRCAAISTYPADATKLILTSPAGAQSFLTSANSGTPSYAGTITGFATRAASDIPWFLAATGGGVNDNINVSDTVMDPVTSGKVWAAGGVGTWYSTSTSGISAWTGLSKGIEQLVTNKLISPPTGGPVGAFWDRAVFYLNPLASYKSAYGPNYTGANGIEMGWSIDYATSSSSYIALLSNWGETDSAYSTDGGQTWTAYANFPNLVGTTIGGSIAASTPDNVVFSAANNGDVYYSQNATSGSATWTRIAASTFGHGMQDAGVGITTGWSNAYYDNRQGLCADRVSANTFYISNYQTALLGGGIYRITFPAGVLTVTQIVSGPTDTGGISTQIHSVPGNAGHLFYTAGQLGSPLRYSTTGGSGTATLTQITGPTDVYRVTTGAIKPGNDYPSVYIAGTIGGTYSIYRSDNSAAQWAGNSVTWTDLGLPLNSIDGISTMAGDNNTYGLLYVGGKGTSCFFYQP